MNFAKFLRTPFFYKTHPVASSEHSLSKFLIIWNWINQWTTRSNLPKWVKRSVITSQVYYCSLIHSKTNVLWMIYDSFDYTFFQMSKYRSSHRSRRCSVKKLFLEISRNSQENNCARVSFLTKLQACFWKYFNVEFTLKFQPKKVELEFHVFIFT